MAYNFNIKMGTQNYTIEIDSKAKYGCFEHDQLGDESLKTTKSKRMKATLKTTTTQTATLKTSKTTNKNFNPVDLKLTEVQADVYNVIYVRQNSGQLTMRSHIQEALADRDKSWICKVIRALIAKGLVERYEQRYYKLAT